MLAWYASFRYPEAPAPHPVVAEDDADLLLVIASGRTDPWVGSSCPVPDCREHRGRVRAAVVTSSSVGRPPDRLWHFLHLEQFGGCLPQPLQCPASSAFADGQTEPKYPSPEAARWGGDARSTGDAGSPETSLRVRWFTAARSKLPSGPVERRSLGNS
jgi:hypothetical protein